MLSRLCKGIKSIYQKLTDHGISFFAAFSAEHGSFKQCVLSITCCIITHRTLSILKQSRHEEKQSFILSVMVVKLFFFFFKDHMGSLWFTIMWSDKCFKKIVQIKIKH